MPVGSPHPFPLGCDGSEPVSVSCSRATAVPQRGSCCAWREGGEAKLGALGRQAGGEGVPLARAGLVSAVGVRSQAEKYGGLVLCLILCFHRMLSLMMMGVLHTP